MSAMASGEDSSTKRPPAEGTMDQGESKKAATGDKACSAVAGEVRDETSVSFAAACCSVMRHASGVLLLSVCVRREYRDKCTVW